MPKCNFCKKEIKEKEKHNAYIVKNGKRNAYYCNVECYNNYMAKKQNKPSTGYNIAPRRVLTDYILYIYEQEGYNKNEIPWQMLMAQLSNILKEHRDEKYSYQSILYALKYMRMIGVNLLSERSNGSCLSLVEYYYNEARDYCKRSAELKKEFENFEIDDSPDIIKKKINHKTNKYKELTFD